MSAYYYSAYDIKGHLHRGEIAAYDEQSALHKIKALGLTPTSMSSQKKPVGLFGNLSLRTADKKLNSSIRSQYLSSLSMLLTAGFVLTDCHRFLSNDTTSRAPANFAKAILEKLQSGQSLSASLRASDGGFDLAQLAAIAAAEKSGDLVGPLRSLSDAIKRSNENRNKLLAALIYPAILVLTSLLSIGIVATILVPNLLPIFEGREQDLPVAISFLSAMTAALTEHYAMIALFLLGAFLLFRIIIKTEAVAKLITRTKRHVGFLRKFECARIASSFALLLRGGTTLLEATKICAANAGNTQLRQELLSVADSISEGKPLRVAAGSLAIFGPMELQMLTVAESSNKLETVLEHIANTNEADATQEIQRLMSLLTPIMTLFMGLLIGGLVYSVMSSILSINQLVR
jgi:general secretion pathway protein F